MLCHTVVFFLAKISRKHGAFFPHKIMYPFWDRLHVNLFFYEACFFVCPQQLLILFSLNSCSLNLFKLEWDESYKITALAQKPFQIYSWVYTLYAHGIFLYMVLNLTKMNMKVLYRTFAESSGLCVWILFISVFFGIRKLIFIIMKLLLHWNH